MTIKHTPGPWNYAKGELHHVHDWVVTARGMKADCPLARLGKWDPVSEPDARLIAASPELLDALKGLLADITEYQTINNLGGETNYWQVQAKAAIDKAEDNHER